MVGPGSEGCINVSSYNVESRAFHGGMERLKMVACRYRTQTARTWADRPFSEQRTRRLYKV